MESSDDERAPKNTRDAVIISHQPYTYKFVYKYHLYSHHLSSPSSIYSFFIVYIKTTKSMYIIRDLIMIKTVVVVMVVVVAVVVTGSRAQGSHRWTDGSQYPITQSC